jgi:biopolymer transport protein ExbD
MRTSAAVLNGDINVTPFLDVLLDVAKAAGVTVISLPPGDSYE